MVLLLTFHVVKDPIHIICIPSLSPHERGLFWWVSHLRHYTLLIAFSYGQVVTLHQLKDFSLEVNRYRQHVLLKESYTHDDYFIVGQYTSIIQILLIRTLANPNTIFIFRVTLNRVKGGFIDNVNLTSLKNSLIR